MKNSIFLVLFFLLFFTSLAQEIKKDTTRHQANIAIKQSNGKVDFNPILSPLRQVAGAPKASWKNYWEYGDGNYSFDDKPTHQYKVSGNYTVRLSATNNYDDGKPPTTRPKDITVSVTDMANNATAQPIALIENHNGFRIQNNRDPSPQEEMQVIVSYSNTKKYPTSGKLYLFFNEKKYKDNNFKLTDIRTYHNEILSEKEEQFAYNAIKSKENFIRTTGIETIISTKRIVNDSVRQDLQSTLEASKLFYKEVKIWNVDAVAPNEERNMFFTFKTTPEMLKDTSAVITIRSIYVPDRTLNEHKIVEKEMEIVTSHDPNKMSVYNTNMNYRLVRFKRLKYKIKFQNNGEGPASLIKLNTDIPQMLDKTTLKVLDMYPKVPLCPINKEVNYSCMDTVISKDQISFQFKNIYLPGSNQKGVKEKDSTKGFVKYSMQFITNFHKKKSVSKTAIIFDKNPPIITNTSTSRFKKGVSIGVKTGYNYYFANKSQLASSTNENASSGYFVGATYSPYKSYKWYYQTEISGNLRKSETVFTNEEVVDVAGFVAFLREKKTTNTKQSYIELVPASVRYNVNAIIGLGFGTQVSLNMKQKQTVVANKKYFEYDQGLIGGELTNLAENTSQTNTINSDAIYNYGLFTDVTFGVSRLGPSVGLRYMYNFKAPTNQLHFYAIWKF